MKQEKLSRNQEADSGEQELDICSATDCTGLIPAGIDSEEELEYYLELYPFLPRPSGKKEE